MNNAKIKATIENLKENFGMTMERLAGEEIEAGPISTKELVALHTKLVTIYGGSLAVKNEELLNEISKAPFTRAFGEEDYKGVFQKAAKYMLDFTRNQVFDDGNNMMGIAAASTYLLSNGIRITVPDEMMYVLSQNIQSGEILSVDEISSIFEEHYEFLMDDLIDLDEEADLDADLSFSY